MTQTPEPLDLDAVQERYSVAFETTWIAETGETKEEFDERTHREQDYAWWNVAKDVPDLVAEIRRLQQMLHPGNGTIANEHRLLETLEHVRIMVRERDAIIEGLEADLAFAQADGGWRALVRQQISELAAKDALIKNLEDASAADQLEIERLRVLLNEAHADADDLLYPGSGNRDPDWYIAQQAADGAFHRMGEQP